MSATIICGIDPGLSGAIALIDEHGTVRTIGMPPATPLRRPRSPITPSSAAAARE